MNRRPCVVIVEDDDGIRTIAQLSLENLGGYEVHAFSSGPLALAGVAALEPALLLLDVSMPGMDGPQTLARLREIPALASVPAAFLTANTQAAQVASYRALGAVDVIAKPFDPAHLCERVAAILSASPSPVRTAQQPTALVVEDDGGIRYLLRFMLEQQGWQVREAGTGTEALQAIERGEVADAVVLDIMLPGVDGLHVLERLRESKRWAGVPVMMLTAKGDERSVQRALAAGANDYLVKPFDPADFTARLHRLPRRAG